MKIYSETIRKESFLPYAQVMLSAGLHFEEKKNFMKQVLGIRSFIQALVSSL